MPKDKNGLTKKQALFVIEYQKDFNATQAAIRAGYSEKTAFSIGIENLNKPLIKAVLSEDIKARFDRESITVDMVLIGLLTEAMRDDERSTHSARVQAWTQLGRYLAMFTDNSNINVQGLEQRMREAEERLKNRKTGSVEDTNR